jgi:outer membrane receptor protein involved in Fe transport
MFTPFDGFRIGGGYTFYGRNYAFYSLSGGSLKLGKEMFVADPWEIPAYGCLDLRASYELSVGKQRMTFFCMMNNVLDSTYIEKAWNPSNVSSTQMEVDPEGVYMFYGLGRNWNAGIKLHF